MKNLEIQYRNFLERNPESTFSYQQYERWIYWLEKQMNSKDRDKFKIGDVMSQLSLSLSERLLELNIEGDFSDLGNEVGYVLGNIIENMTEEEIKNFVSGLKHGISLTNGTH